MKRFFVAMGLLLATVAVFAQPQGNNRPSAEERAKRQTERLKTELTLTADQETKVYNLYLAAGKQMEAARGAAGENREAMRAKMDSVRKDSDVKLKAVLTSAQITKYEALQKQMEAERQQRRSGGQRPPQ